MSQRKLSLIFLAAAAGIAVLLYKVRGVLLPFLLAAVMAYIINPLVGAFEARQIPRSIAILLAYAVFAVVGIAGFYICVPLLVTELDEMLAAIPRTRSLGEFTSETIRGWGPWRDSRFFRSIVSNSAQQVEKLLAGMVGRSLEVAFGLLARTFTLILVPFLAFYLLRDMEMLRSSALSLVPSHLQGEVQELALRLNRLVAAFLRGQLIVAVTMGLLISVGLAILQVKYAFVIGAVAGAFEFIPYLGPVVATVPAILFGLMRSPVTALWAAVWILAVHQVEAAVLQPQVMSSTVGLHPLTIIFSILVGGELLGIWGMFLAVPLAAVLKEIGGYLLGKAADLSH